MFESRKLKAITIRYVCIYVNAREMKICCAIVVNLETEAEEESDVTKRCSRSHSLALRSDRLHR